MFGTYRTLLALFVLIGHLIGPIHLGFYSVFGFYVLSGYLMTFVMNNNYGHTLAGKKKFAINRCLRIYPPYYAAALISIFLLYLFGDRVTTFKSEIHLPDSSTSWLQNISLIFPRDASPRLSPATWALTVELFFYLCICLGLSKNRRITIFWLLSSCVITVYLFLFKPWGFRYFTIVAGSLPFSVGAMLFHYKTFLLNQLQKTKLTHPFFWLCLILVNFFLAKNIQAQTGYPYLMSFGFYTNLALVTCCTLSLINYSSNLISKKLNDAIGKYSYPLYLVHWQAGAIVYCLSDGRLNIRYLEGGGDSFLTTQSTRGFNHKFYHYKSC